MVSAGVHGRQVGDSRTPWMTPRRVQCRSAVAATASYLQGVSNSMRVRDHVVLSSGAAALLYPSIGGQVVLPWAASIFIDVDHYLWFLVRHHRLNPVTAVRLFNDANAPKHPATRPFHHPVALSLLLLLGR